MTPRPDKLYGKDGRLTARGRGRLFDEAQRHLIHALAGLYDDRGDMAMTLLETGRALYTIAQLDEGRTAYDRVMAMLDEARRQ